MLNGPAASNMKIFVSGSILGAYIRDPLVMDTSMAEKPPGLKLIRPVLKNSFASIINEVLIMLY